MTQIEREGGLEPAAEYVELEAALGINFQQIYDKVLCKSLREYVLLLQKKLANSEADRAARLEVIERQGKEFAVRLSECEADRAARLEVIKRFGRELYEKSEEFNRKLEEMDNVLRSREAEIRALKMSYSWLITGPVRWIAVKMGIRGRH